jgi:PAT family beta-lactamase induction signal transducer AmpG
MDKKSNPWTWIPTLYMAEALPYVAVMTVSVIMYKRMGISNTDIALYTGWLYLPWVIKPFWSPFVDLVKTKRWWTVSMQFVIAIAFACIAFTLPMSLFFQLSLAAFWLVAFTSATHDIAADGYYMHALDDHEQSFYVGIRSTFYRIATVAGQGLLVVFAGYLEESTDNIPLAWSVTMGILSIVFFLTSLYHQFILPRPVSDRAVKGVSAATIAGEFLETFRSFFFKKNALIAILFMLLYRLPEALLVKIISPFMLDPVDMGGLGLSTSDVGWVYGTVGIIGLTIGGILGGIAAAHGGLKKWLWPMVAAITLPDLVYVYLSALQPESLMIVNLCVFIEQFGYGFGFTAYMLYLIYFADGEHKTAHYAMCTGFMALGMMLPGMMAGWLQETIGYQHFFVLTIVCCAATFAVCAFLKIDPGFGKKKNE